MARRILCHQGKRVGANECGRLERRPLWVLHPNPIQHVVEDLALFRGDVVDPPLIKRPIGAEEKTIAGCGITPLDMSPRPCGGFVMRHEGIAAVIAIPHDIGPTIDTEIEVIALRPHLRPWPDPAIIFHHPFGEVELVGEVRESMTSGFQTLDEITPVTIARHIELTRDRIEIAERSGDEQIVGLARRLGEIAPLGTVPSNRALTLNLKGLVGVVTDAVERDQITVDDWFGAEFARAIGKRNLTLMLDVANKRGHVGRDGFPIRFAEIARLVPIGVLLEDPIPH